MRKLEMSRDARKFFQELQAKQFRQVGLKMLALMVDAEPPDAEQVKGRTDYWRTDIGEYRIIYEFDDTTVSIVLIGKRNDDAVYKKMERL